MDGLFRIHWPPCSGIRTLEVAIQKIKSKKARLQQVYLDPEIGMTKDEFLQEKHLLDDQINAMSMDIEKIANELKKNPSRDDLLSLEQMALQIARAVGSDFDLSPYDKRKVMQMLNLKVLIYLDGRMKLEGSFSPECDSLLSTTS